MPSFKQVELRDIPRQVRRGSTPDWAQGLTVEVCRAFEAEVPELRWSTKKERSYANGWCMYKAKLIKINAGYDERNAMAVLLHELAHWLVRGGHTYSFWRMVFALQKEYGYDEDWWYSMCYRMAVAYKARARDVAPRLFIEAYRRVIDGANS